MSGRGVCAHCGLIRWIPLGNAPYCTKSCQRAAAAMAVHCAVCDQPWRAHDPGVAYRSIDGKWQCQDHFACKRRARARNAEVAAMYRALDKVWDQLAKDGWRWPDAAQ